MSERYENVGSALIDNAKPQSTKCIGNFRRSSECEKICNLLNMQEELIDSLKSDNMEKEERIKFFKEENIHLNEILKELKQYIKDFEKEIYGDVE